MDYTWTNAANRLSRYIAFIGQIPRSIDINPAQDIDDRNEAAEVGENVMVWRVTKIASEG